ncbi:hypothetical protein BWGOE8_12700 [Bacillus mycoides]|uniref:Uncharacterized protein n=1 Tax=Bacillus mycoides TaxID=1405 RepID=A0A1E8BBS0_BACMY|nr:hypothetical protein BWGOE8_12700 [Bacillus mycoides]OFD83069.1 hypothetical protein BWGOE9_12370 [Bacillus mycoides]OFD85500.1 hypothetical protein BWGOE10_12520 [Bacillus mycoides]
MHTALSVLYCLKKLNLHNIISIENGVDSRYTVKLTHFINEETEKANSYAYISPVVFMKAFFKLSVAARKQTLAVYIASYIKNTRIKSVLEEMNIGKFASNTNKFIHVLKHTYHRQIRSVTRSLRDMVDRNKEYPTKLVYNTEKIIKSNITISNS